MEESKLKRTYEIMHSILGLKLGLFHVTHEFSDPGITDLLNDIEENDDDLIVDYIYQGLDFSNAQKRFKNVKLTESAKNKRPHEKMNEYLTEAFWCYVIGMFKACVALCRTAMEIGLRDQVSERTLVEYKERNCDKLIQEERKHFEKGNIKMAKSLMTLIEVDLKKLCKRKGVSENKIKELKKSAHCIRIKGNIIVHSQKDTADREQETRDILLMTREFLAEIYNL